MKRNLNVAYLNGGEPVKSVNKCESGGGEITNKYKISYYKVIADEEFTESSATSLAELVMSLMVPTFRIITREDTSGIKMNRPYAFYYNESSHYMGIKAIEVMEYIPLSFNIKMNDAATFINFDGSVYDIIVSAMRSTGADDSEIQAYENIFRTHMIPMTEEDFLNLKID